MDTYDVQSLVPLRIKDRHIDVGDRSEGLTSKRGITRALVYATIESVLTESAVNERDRHILASFADPSLLDFDSYQDEYESELGRSALQIIADEGVAAYEELVAIDDRIRNSYLEAALCKIPIYDAITDELPHVIIETPDGIKKIKNKSYGPSIISATIEHDGETYTTDFRTSIPSIEFVMDNWSAVGGHRKLSFHMADNYEYAEKLDDMIDDPADTIDMIVNRTDDGITFHYVRDRFESITEDEDDMIRSYCGIEFYESRPRFDIGHIEHGNVCKACEQSY